MQLNPTEISELIKGRIEEIPDCRRGAHRRYGGVS